MKNKVCILLIIGVFLCSCNRNVPNVKKEIITKMEILKAEHNFGKVKIGKKVEGFFVVKNTGPNDLIYKQVIPGCGCTLVKQNNKIVEAGKIDTLYFSLDTHGKEAGEKQLYVRIITNTNPDLHKFVIVVELE